MKKTTLFFLFFVVAILKVNAQLSEDFESGFPPTGWAIADNGNGTSIDWETSSDSFSGAMAAFIDYEFTGSTEDWLISPQFTPINGENILTFYQKQGDNTDQGSTFSVRVSESGSNIGDFTITVDTQSEDDFSDQYGLKTVDLSAYNDTPIYVAFVLEQDGDGGDSWYIDKVSTINPTAIEPDCALNPTPVIAESNTINLAMEVFISWDAPAISVIPTSYKIYAGINSGSLDFKAEVGNTNYTLTDVPYEATYYWEIVPQNYGVSANDCVEWNFTTGLSPGIPTNDSCTSAIVISEVPFMNIQDALFATNNYPEDFGFVWECDDGGFGGMNDGVWYTFTTNTGGNLNIDITDVSSAFDVEVAVYSGNCNDLICIGNKNTAATGFGASESLSVTVDDATQYWINVGEKAAGEENPEGAFKISLTLDGGTILGIEEIENDLDVNIFPNPTNGIINLKYENTIDAIRIYNLLGQEVNGINLNKSRTQIDMTNFNSGMYVVDVYSGNTKGSYRVIKQ